MISFRANGKISGTRWPGRTQWAASCPPFVRLVTLARRCVNRLAFFHFALMARGA